MEFVVAIALIALLTGWLILWRMSKVQSRAVGEVFADLFRPDLDRVPISARAINKRYQKVVRGSGKPGPAGLIQPRKHIVILTPAEDYAYIQSFDIVDFEEQLLSYLRKYASEMGWSASDSVSPTTIHFTRDERRRRLRPSLSLTGLPEKATTILPPHVADDMDGEATEFLQPNTPSSTEERPGRHDTSSEATAAYTPGPTTASLTYEGRSIALSPTAKELTVGRAADNDIVIDHTHYSREHLIVWLENGQWHVKVDPGSWNPTHLNGRPLKGETVLAHGDRITVGSSTPLVFNAF